MPTNRHLGRAAATKHKLTITIALTWATGDTVTVTLNGKALKLTVGALVTTADVAAALKAMLAGDNALGSETRSALGKDFQEFLEMTWTVSGSVVTAEGKTAGKPFDFAVVEVTAGDGTATKGTSITATGPNHANDANNWSLGTTPANAEDVVVDSGVPILYGLDALSAVTLASLTVDHAQQQIGLPKTNVEGQYPEYRPDYLLIGATTITVRQAALVKVNVGAVQTAVEVIQGTEVHILGTHASNAAENNGGALHIATYGGEVSTFAEVKTSGGTTVTGSGCTKTLEEQSGGTVRSYKGATTFRQRGGDSQLFGTAPGTFDFEFGTADYRCPGTLATVTHGGGGRAFLDLSRDTSTIVFTNYTYHPGAEWSDPHGRLTITTYIRGDYVKRFTVA